MRPRRVYMCYRTKKLQTELLGDVCGNGTLVDEDVHRLVSHVGLGGVEHAVVLAVVAPRVLDHEVFVALLVLGEAVNHHAVVVGGLPVVVAELAEFLRDGLFVVGGLDGCAVLGVAARPASSIGAGDVVVFERSRHAGHAIAAEIAFAHVGTPCEGVAVAHGGVAHFHELIERQVVALCPAPVVLNFKDKLGVEGMMRVGGERYVVVGVEAEVVGSVLLRRVGLAAGNNRCRQFAKIVLIDIGKVALPGGRDFLQVALGDGADISGSHGVELVEVEERVAIERTREGHGVLRHDAVVLEAIDCIVERTALREAGVAVGAHGLVGAVHVGFVHEERFAQVV